MKRIYVIIPVYKSLNTIFNVLDKIDKKLVDKIILVDDNCPFKTSKFLKKKFKLNKKIEILVNKSNLGVGGACKKAFNRCLKLSKKSLIIKIDSDGQINPKYIFPIINKYKKNKFKFIKGNRFAKSNPTDKMPFIRFIGNKTLGFISSFATGQKIIDPTNGFFLIESDVLKEINFKKLSDDYFFESDLINKISLKGYKIGHFKMDTIYKNIESNLKIYKIILPFMINHLKFFIFKK